MKVSVYFTPVGLSHQDVAGRPVLVVDVLRTTTTIITALGNGARAVLPASSAEDAIRLAQNLERDDVRLAGEQGFHPIEGFHFGNSPTAMTPDQVEGLTLVLTTTDGTPAILAAEGGSDVLLGAPVNFTAAAEAARRALDERGELIILCAGRAQRFAIEDAYVAGRFVREILPPRGTEADIDDAAIAAQHLVRRYGERWKAAVGAGEVARTLQAAGYKADVVAATEVDRYAIVPRFAERQVRI